MAPQDTALLPHERLRDLLSTFSSDPNRRGEQFEQLCAWYLRNDPVYGAQLSRVWLWKEWPGRWGDDEAGIDLVAETRDGQLWAVQAKAYDPAYSVKKSDIDSFLSESARAEFSYRLLIATTSKLARLAERAMRAQEKPVGQLLLHDLEHADVAWPVSISDLQPAAPKRKEPRPHQLEAIDAIVAGCAVAGRGQVIMACGTGKTLVELWAAETLEAERTLVLVPSLSLLKQTIQEWLANSSREFEFLPVCSDDTVRDHDQPVARVAALGFPATGDPLVVREFLAREGPRVVFSTYQSSPVVASALKSPGLDFDLAVADEAHRCAGPATSDFATILDDDQIAVRKRLFFTATPRYFSGKVKKAGAETDFEIVSMDDDDRFGPVFQQLSFGTAIKRDLLSDYRVLVIGVDDETYLQYAKEGLFVTRDGEKVTDARSLASQIGIAKAVRKYDLRRVITFHSRVKAAQNFSKALADVVDWLPAEARPGGTVWANHVSGDMNAAMRESRLRRLREVEANTCGVLSNARCLSEGVDVPALDGVAFVDSKKSAIDITQAVGRAIRKSEAKELGTIVIPVFIDTEGDAEATLAGSAFKPVWDVVRGLREHDSDLAETLDALRRGLGGGAATRPLLPSKLVIDLPRSVGADFARAFDVRLVESCTANFEHWFGLLLQYVDRQGDARVPRSHVERGFGLGNWVKTQRRLYKTLKLAAERVARFEALPSWTWDPNQAAWEEGFGALATYVEREGHARVPAKHREAELKLGQWVRVQRGLYRSGRLASERIARLEALPGWAWDAREAVWDATFGALGSFVEREGHARVPHGHVESEYNLGSWVNTQRQSYRSRNLEPERVARLEALPGWSWDPYATDWEEGFAALEAYVAREGHARAPQSHVESGFNLGTWMSNQRQDFRSGELDSGRVARLAALPGWTWDPQRDRWEDHFAALVSFADREGHARVPQGYIESALSLGSWVNTQRAFYKAEKLEPGRVERLEAVPGWTWDARETAWEEGFGALTAYVERERHAGVPLDHVESGINLRNWVKVQRRLRKAGKLEAERIAQLEALPGWTWDAREASWEEGFASLTAYVDREGHARVSQGHVEHGFRLGAWINRQRQSYRAAQLEPERIARIEALPGWAWDPHQAAWEEGFAALTDYVRREGHARVPAGHVESDYNLGKWAGHQRRAYAARKLVPERIAQLEILPGWVWDARQAAWEESFAALTTYVEREGHARVPADHVEFDYNLGKWASHQRRFYKAEKLEAERAERLEALPGWVWDTRQALWEEAFALVSAYVEREGHARVPVSWVEAEYNLGSWVNTQRQAFKSDKLEPERAARLEALPGWMWAYTDPTSATRLPATSDQGELF